MITFANDDTLTRMFKRIWADPMGIGFKYAFLTWLNYPNDLSNWELLEKLTVIFGPQGTEFQVSSYTIHSDSVSFRKYKIVVFSNDNEHYRIIDQLTKSMPSDTNYYPFDDLVIDQAYERPEL